MSREASRHLNCRQTGVPVDRHVALRFVRSGTVTRLTWPKVGETGMRNAIENRVVDDSHRDCVMRERSMQRRHSHMRLLSS